MSTKKRDRLFRALAREGLDVTHADGVYTVRVQDDPDAAPAEVLLPDELPLEARAVQQLAALASARHPDGGRVRKTIATPDFHPGDAGIAIGSVIATDTILIPAAVGADINCGMRLHVTDLTAAAFREHKDAFVEGMKNECLLGNRDLPMTSAAFRALFTDGLMGWHEIVARQPLGLLTRADFAQIERELERVAYCGSLSGNPRYVDERLVSVSDIVRDGGLATIGGGNHFVEVQEVVEVIDRKTAWEWGVRLGQVAFMIHSGSRSVGKGVGGLWRDKAKTLWPEAEKFPSSQIFPISLKTNPEAAAQYLVAEATAANYGFLNRLLLAEMLRLRLRALYRADMEAPLVYDIPHNITAHENGQYVTRKGACPAHTDQPVIIPGSMGALSYLLKGMGNARFLCSASHGAGRAEGRFSLARAGNKRTEADLGLTGVECITLRPERRIEEAPAAYKPITPVINAQVAAGIVSVVAKLQPILTFKA